MSKESYQQISESFRERIRASERLLLPVEEADWDSELETPIQKIHLGNEIEVYFLLQDNPDWDLGFTVKYPTGSHEDPASHLIEHLVTHPAGITKFPEKAIRADISFNAETNRSETSFYLGIGKRELVAAQKRYGQAFEDLSCLLLGMTAFPEITEENVTLEKGRMASEFAGRRDRLDTRLTDYILPLVTLDRKFCTPNFSEETGFTTEELKERHKIRPHQGIKIYVSGNPREEKGLEKITEALEKTFGQVQGLKESPFPKKEAPKKLFPFGNDFKITPSHPLKDHLVGVITVSDLNSPKEKLGRTGALVNLLSSIPPTFMHQKGLSYGTFHHNLWFESSKSSLVAFGVTTTQPETSVGFLKKVIDELPGKAKTLDIDYHSHFQTVQATSLNSLFSRPNFERIESAEILGLPIEYNAKALYDFIKSFHFEDILKAAQEINSENRLAFFHYGQGKPVPGFSEVSEEELVKIWLAS